MNRTRLSMILNRTVLAAVATMAFTGCDYWPPALQAQIEQLRNEVKQAVVERATLEEQLNTATKINHELQAKVDDLTRSNQDMTARMATLDQALIAERQKMARMIEAAKKGAPTAGVKAKASPKSATKAAAKKKPTKARAAKTSVAGTGKAHQSNPSTR